MRFKLPEKKAIAVSVIFLVILICLVFLLPPFLGKPFKVVAEPFAVPYWFSFFSKECKDLPPTMHFSFSNVYRYEFCYDYLPPKTFVMRLKIKITDKDGGSLLLLKPLGKKVKLFKAPKRGVYLINIDSKDPLYKKELGLSPFDNLALVLLNERGRYKIVCDGGMILSGEILIPGLIYGIMGTDYAGRDLFKLWLLGGRISLIIGFLVASLSTSLGVLMGISSGYIGGIWDELAMNIVDLLMAIPGLPLLIIVSAAFGKNLYIIAVIIALLSWMGTARTVRSKVLVLKELPYVEAVKFFGAKSFYIMYRYILPGVLPIVLVSFVLSLPNAIVFEASLSFLGLGDPSVVSWGRLLGEARSFGAFSAGAWWCILAPGIGIVWVCSVFLVIGRSLQRLMQAGV